MRVRAFTLTEILVVIAILLIAASLLLPVFKRAQESSLETVTKSNLRQIFLQTQLYIADYDGAPTGTTYDMGLPPIPQPDRLDSLVKLRPPKAPHALSKTLGTSYYSNYCDPQFDQLFVKWKHYTTDFEGAAILYIDPFFNDPTKSLMFGDYYRRKMIAINVSGSVVVRYLYGDWMLRTWT